VPSFNPYLTHDRDFALPSWVPHLLGPLSQEELQAYLTKQNPDTQIKVKGPFHFYHGNLGPTNILVPDEAEINGITDWESAGYYPRFWIDTKPLVSAGFYFSSAKDLVNKKAWAVLLGKYLERKGFGPYLDMYCTVLYCTWSGKRPHAIGGARSFISRNWQRPTCGF